VATEVVVFISQLYTSRGSLMAPRLKMSANFIDSTVDYVLAVVLNCVG